MRVRCSSLLVLSFAVGGSIEHRLKLTARPSQGAARAPWQGPLRVGLDVRRFIEQDPATSHQTDINRAARVAEIEASPLNMSVLEQKLSARRNVSCGPVTRGFVGFAVAPGHHPVQ